MGKVPVIQETSPDSSAGTIAPPQPMKTEKQTRYVVLPEGLALYNVPKELKSGFIRKLAYGTPVEVLQPTDSAGNQMEYTYQGITGIYCKVVTMEDSGYVFAPFLSQLPVPALQQTRPMGRLEAYIDSLKAMELVVKLENPSKNEEGGEDFAIEIPASNIHEAFLIARIAFNIPSEYRFPKQAHTVLSSFEKPSKVVANSPYDYVNHTFDLGRDDLGDPISLTYEDDSEVGGRRVVIAPCEIGWRISQLSWTH